MNDILYNTRIQNQIMWHRAFVESLKHHPFLKTGLYQLLGYSRLVFTSDGAGVGVIKAGFH